MRVKGKPAKGGGVTGLKAAFVDRHGPAFKQSDVDDLCLKMIKNGDYFNRKAKQMTTDIDQATAHVDNVNERFSKSIQKLSATEKRFSDESKKASGSVRDAASKLAEGLSRIEKAANFDRLERYVLLLERAAAAMETLSELDRSGRLSKISDALK